ncbi:MAG: hypothetical protein NTZ05_17980, partial [Chloroflexi bacterium]|nr:hypothetical protein [Chloroflexota bacterium]
MPNDPASGNRDPGAARPELPSLFPPEGAERRRLIGNFDAPEPPPAPARPQRPPDPPPAVAPLPDFMTQGRFTDPANQAPFDPSEPLARSQHAINLLLYMTTGMAYGLMVSTHWRVSDALNAGGHEHLTLRDGTLAAGLFGQGASGWADDALLTSGEMFVRQESVVLAAPTEVLPWAEGPRNADRMWVAKDEYPVVVDAGPYRVYGWVHVPLTKPLAEVLSLRYGRFMPVTNARVRAHPGVRPDEG